MSAKDQWVDKLRTSYGDWLDAMLDDAFDSEGNGLNNEQRMRWSKILRPMNVVIRDRAGNDGRLWDLTDDFGADDFEAVADL